MFNQYLDIRRAATLAAMALSAWAAQPAVAGGGYFTTDATIDYALNGGAVVGSDAAGNRSSPTVRIVSGGSVTGLFTYGGSTVIVSGGQVNNVPGAFPFSVAETSALTLASGLIDCPTSFSGSSRLSVTGGSITYPVSAVQSSTVTISGGTFTRGVYADNFYDGTTGGFTFIGSGLGATPTGSGYYTLSGRLQDGTSLNGDVIYVANGATMFTLVAAPEPSSVAAFALGALGLAAMRLRHKRRLHV